MTQCERRLACNGDQVAYGQCQQYAELCPAYYFSDGTTRTLESVQACIAQLRQLSCTDLALQMFARMYRRRKANSRAALHLP